MSNLADLIGVRCMPVDDIGTLAVADIAIEFADKDPVFVYVEKVGQKIRFSDEGDVVSHMLGRGVDLDDRSDATFITCLTEPEGVTLNEQGDLEIWADPLKAQATFLRFVAAMLAVVAWESTTSTRVRIVGERPKVVLEQD
jgi:hypothetical protein